MINEIYKGLMEIAEKSGYGKDEWVKNRILNVALRDDIELAKVFEKKLIYLADLNPNPFPKGFEDEFQGNIHVGSTSFGSEVFLTLDDLSQSLIQGETYRGKSVLQGKLYSEILENTDATPIIFDPKRSFRTLTRFHEKAYVVRLDRFPFNPFSAFNSTNKMWLQDFAGVLAQTGDLMTGSRSFILDVLNSLMERFQNEKMPPTMFDLRDEVNKKQYASPPYSKPRRYGEVVSNRLESLLFIFKDSLSYYYGFPLEKLLDNSVSLIFEYDSIDPIYAKTLILLIIQSLYNYQMLEGNRGGDPDLIIMLDEAEEILGHGDRRLDLGLDIVNKIFERSKELQIGLIASCHHSRINPVVQENSRSRFCFNLSSYEDISKVSGDFGLTEDQEEIVATLGVGEAVAKVKDQREDPFMLQVDPIELEDVPDEEINSKNEELWKKVKNSIIPREKKISSKKKNKEQDKVSKNSHVLLENIARHPYLSISERKDKLGWSNTRLSKIRKKLRGRGYIRNKKLIKPEGGRGSSLTLLELTGKAINYLEKEGIKTKYIGRGGANHSYYMQWFLDNLKKRGVDVSYETDLGGISVDLFFIKNNGSTHAVEIEVSSSKQTLNKMKKLLKKVDKLLIACDKKVLVDEFKQEIEEMNIDHDRVRVRKIQDIEF